MPARAFKRIKAFLRNKFKRGSQKDDETDTHKENILQPEPPKSPAPLITAAEGFDRPGKPFQELPSEQLPPVERPPAPEPAESFTAAASPSTTPTTATTTVDVNDKVVFKSPFTSRLNSSPIQNSSRLLQQRARQNVLFEIVSSEERYTSELAKMKESFIDPLLRSFSSTSAPPQPSKSSPGTSLQDISDHDECLHTGSTEFLESLSATSRPRPPSVPSRSTTPVPQSTEPEGDISRERAFREAPKNSTPLSVTSPGTIPPVQLPEDLRICLEVIENDLVEGHVRLSEALKKGYEEQLPQVQSLEDVLVNGSKFLEGYPKYVLHLERAIEQVVNALKCTDGKSPGPTKKQGGPQLLELGAYIGQLEKDAGGVGLVVSLSKPFQRLFKYHLMFQNLLHTDLSPSQHEDALKMMITEVETIVGSIGDERIQEEDRNVTSDVLERIDGFDITEQFALPKYPRVLIEERAVSFESGVLPPGQAGGNPLFQWLSDVSLAGRYGNLDLWFVVFNDVVLRCRRTGTTSLPRWGVYSPRTDSIQQTKGTATLDNVARTKPQSNPRNLYKFLKVETWDVDCFRERMDIVPARIPPNPADDDVDDEDEDSDDRKTKATSSTWGADMITLHKPISVQRPRRVVSTRNGVRRAPVSDITANRRESYSNGKFGSRLLSSERTAPPPRPSSRRTGLVGNNNSVTRSPSRARDSGIGVSRQILASGNATLPAGHPVSPYRRSSRRIDAVGINNSTAKFPSPREDLALDLRNSASEDTIWPTKPTAASLRTSPRSIRVKENNSATKSPSLPEDSGIGLYRQILANDPSLANGPLAE